MSHMRIVLTCDKCEKIADKRFKGIFRPHPFTEAAHYIQIEMDCPMVPGNRYELLLKGCFPTDLHPRDCVSDMLAFSCMDNLKATDVIEEAMNARK